MNICIKHPTNPSIAIGLNIKDSSLQMTVGTLLSEIGHMFFAKNDDKNIDVSDFWRLRDEKTNEYMDVDLPLSKLNANGEFTIAFGIKPNNDLDQINAYAEELNQEAEDVLDYQAVK